MRYVVKLYLKILLRYTDVRLWILLISLTGKIMASIPSKKNITASKASTIYVDVKPVKSIVSSKSVFKPPLRDDFYGSLITVPPNGNWGWVIVSCAWIMSFVTDGTSYTFGIFIKDLSESFKRPPSSVAVASSVMTGVYYLVGPLVCAVINRYGFRFTGFLGGILSALAIGVCSLINSLLGFLILFGGLCGLGFSMIYVPSLMIVGFYFDRWRAVATAITVCGSSAGIISFPPIIRILMCNLTWRNKFKILSGLCFFCSILALAYKPLKPTKVVAEDKKVQPSQDALSRSTVDSTERNSIQEDPSGNIMEFFQKFHNKYYATVAEVAEGASVGYAASRTSTASYVLQDVSMSSVGTKTKSIVESERLSTLLEEDADNEKRRRHCCFSCEVHCAKRCPCLYPHEDITANRPMYRDDIFFTGSLSTLYESAVGMKISRASSRVSKKSAFDYHISVTRVTTQKDLEENRFHCICCPVAIRRTLATMLEFGLMKSFSFNLVLMSGFFTTLGMYTPFVFIIEYAVEKNIATNLAVYLISAVGISNCVGRLLCGFASSLPHVGALRFSYVSFIVCGGFTMGSIYCYNVALMFLFVSMFGLSIAALPCLRSIMLVDMYGLEKLTNSFGLVMLFQGIACMLGVPISAALADHTGTYNASFLFAGGTIAFSGLLLLPVNHVLRWERKREAEKLEESRSKAKRVTTI